MFFDQIQQQLEEGIEQLSSQIAASFGAVANVHYERRYPPTSMQ